MASPQLPPLPAIERLSPRVIRILGGNPGKFTLQGTNTYLVGTGPGRILIDTGAGEPAWAASLQAALAAEAASVERVVLTHWHPDHVSGVADALRLSPGAGVSKFAPETGSGRGALADGDELAVAGASLRVVHCPGHTTDHVALVLAEEAAMFTGDNVLGHGTAVFEDLPAYVRSLERMRGEFAGRAYPGHGAVVEDGPGKVAEYIAHRRQREQEAVELLGRPREEGGGEEGWASMEMVRVIYKAYPASLHGPAEGGLLQVLKKLEAEGRAREADGRWSLVDKERL